MPRQDFWRSTNSPLLARRLSQGIVDALLPARAAFLEVFENVLVDPQGHQLLDAGKRRFLWRRLRRLGGGFLERRLGLGAGVVQGAWSSGLIGHGQMPSNNAVDR